MNSAKKQKMSTETIALGAILTAMVILLQLMGAVIKFGMFSVSLVLIPIVIGAATCGEKVGAWLGFVFGAIVLISGDAAVFLGINAVGTVITVLLKGTACGYLAGLAYKLVAKKNATLGVIVAALVCPVVNTGIFLVGCAVFFLDAIREWAGGGNVVYYAITGLVGFNFLFELGVNIVLSPVIVRILNIPSVKKLIGGKK